MVRSLFFFFILICRLSAGVTALYLTWYKDPAATMAIHWHTPEYEPGDTIYLQTSDGSWHAVVGTHIPLRYLLVHTVHLSQLQADTEYTFRIGNDPTLYKFKTAPNKIEKPLRFIIGGDADQTTKLFRKMNETIVKEDPLFCVIGGDVAYALNPAPFQFASSPFNRYISFLSTWKEQMVTKGGRLIPFLLCAGNHDLTAEDSDLFFSLFPFPEGKLYRALDFGSFLSLILLDTDHYSPIEGEQTTWLKSALSERENVLFRFAIYHEAAYPSYYPYQGLIPKKIRTFWCPLFDQYKLSAAFENHNHAFKRTHPLTNNEIDPKGIIYFGDGCWGARPRITNDLWYLAKRARKNNVYLIELKETEAHIKAIDLTGASIDEVRLAKTHHHYTQHQIQDEFLP